MNKYEELEKLQNLKEAGSLTEDEFEREKKKILGQESNEVNKSNKLSTAGFVLGIISFLVSGLITGIVGIVLSAKAKHKAKLEGEKDEKATVGLVLSIIGVVKASIAILVCILCFTLVFLSEDVYTTQKEYRIKPNHGIHRSIEINNENIDSMIDDFFND